VQKRLTVICGGNYAKQLSILPCFGGQKVSNVLAFRAKVEAKPATQGYALLHRKIRELPFYRQDSEAVHLWLHFILSANYQPAIVQTEVGDIMVQRGQFIAGRNSLASDTGIEPNRVQYLMRKFKKLGMIETQSPGKFTLITIVKYDEYQGDFAPKNDPKKVPDNYQIITSSNPDVAGPAKEVVPDNYQTITTNNKYNNKYLSNDRYMSSGDDESAPTSGEQKHVVQGEGHQPAEQGTTPQKKSASIPYQAVLDAYNVAADGRLPMAQALNDKRRRAIKRLLGELKAPTAEAAANYFGAFMEKAGPFYFGENNTGWRASFDYLLRSDTLIKTREGSL